MFIWPDGSVTGSINWDELEDFVARKGDKSVTPAGWDALSARLDAHRQGPAAAAEPSSPGPGSVEDPADGDEAPSAPKQSDTKADWVAYAESQGSSFEDADAMTKVDLIEKYGHKEA